LLNNHENFTGATGKGKRGINIYGNVELKAKE